MSGFEAERRGRPLRLGSGARQQMPPTTDSGGPARDDQSAPVPPNRKADGAQVIQQYQELRHLRRTGEEFGITRGRMRQIMNRATISVARIPKPKPEKLELFCKQCEGTSVLDPRTLL